MPHWFSEQLGIATETRIEQMIKICQQARIGAIGESSNRRIRAQHRQERLKLAHISGDRQSAQQVHHPHCRNPCGNKPGRYDPRYVHGYIPHSANIAFAHSPVCCIIVAKRCLANETAVAVELQRTGTPHQWSRVFGGAVTLPGRAVLASLADQHSAVLGAVEDAPASPVPQAASSTAPARRALVAARSGRRDGRLGRT
jgi:hypothetical protein